MDWANYEIDMHALLGMTVEWSDNDGDSWSPITVATDVRPVQDHQTIASTNAPTGLHPTTWMFCINGNALTLYALPVLMEIV